MGGGNEKATGVMAGRWRCWKLGLDSPGKRRDLNAGCMATDGRAVPSEQS